MITKLCIVCLCIVGCSMFGLKFHKDSKQRVLYYESLVSLINQLSSNVQFRQESLKSFLSRFAQENQSQLNVTVQEFLKYLEDNSVPFLPSKQRLKAAETDAVRTFFLSLGTNDSETQLFELTAYQKKFEEMLEICKEKHKKYGGLYLKLSFLLGLALGILII